MRFDYRNPLLAIVSLVIFILGVEIMLRVTGIQSTHFTPSPLLAKPYLQNSDFPVIGYDLKPGFDDGAHFVDVTINDDGFRGPEIDPAKPSIAFIGDSITFGYGVGDSETLPQRVREVFPMHNVINAGVPGYDLVQETETYVQKIAPLAPEAVVLVYYWNDLRHPEYPSFVDERGVLRPHGWKPTDVECSPIEEGVLGLLPGRCWLDLNSTFYLAVKKLVNLRHSQVKSKEDRKEAKEGKIDDPISLEDLEQYTRELDAFVRALPPDLPKVFVIWPDRFIHNVSLPALKKRAEERGFVVVDLYEHVGNDFEILSWDYTHPNGNALREASVPVITALRSLLGG